MKYLFILTLICIASCPCLADMNYVDINVFNESNQNNFVTIHLESEAPISICNAGWNVSQFYGNYTRVEYSDIDNEGKFQAVGIGDNTEGIFITL